MKISVIEKISMVFLLMALLIVAMGAIGCGDSREKVEKSFAFDPKGGASQGDLVSIQDGTQLNGSIGLGDIDQSEYGIIAATDFSGRLIEEPQVKIVIKVSEKGLIEQGEMVIRGRDRANGTADDFMTYRATCSSQEGRHCGVFVKGVLDVRFFDGVGYVELKTVPKGQNEMSGDIRVDGRPQRLGTVNLKNGDLKNEPLN